MATRDIILAAAGGSPAASDPQFEYVTLLLSGDGTNGAQNNTFLDSSANNFTITRNGNTTQGSFSPYGNLWSNFLSSTSERLTTSSSSSAFSFGTGDFTIECWYSFRNPAEASINAIFQTSTASTGYNASYSNSSALYWDRGGSRWGIYAANNEQFSSAVTPVAGVWYHLAIVRSSGTTKLYLDGTSIISVADTTNYTMTYCVLGAIFNTSYAMRGSISNFRVVKGTAVYTTNFTPPTTPLTAITNTSFLTCQSNRFVDNSSSALGLTISGAPIVQRFSPFEPTAEYSTSVIGGSGYFDGDGDSLYGPTNSAFQLGTGDFTVESWVYSTSTTKNMFVDTRDPSFVNGPGAGFGMFGGDNTELSSFINNSGYSFSDLKPRANCWNHVAYVRSSGTFYAYLNGVRSATSHSLTANLTANFCTIGTNANNRAGGGSINAVWWPQGYMTDVRFSKSAVYTGATYTVPTAPLSTVSNMSLLLGYKNAGIPDLAMMNDLETVGNAQVSTSVKKFGTGSLAFDGTGDGLTAPPNQNLALGTGQYTVECWIRFNTVTNIGEFVCCTTSGNSGCFTLYYANGGLQAVATGGAGATTVSWTPVNNQWYHIAATRDASNNQRVFVDGVLLGTATSTNNYGQNGFTAVLGNSLNGYMDDIRITKGVARYVSSFTPPTKAFPTF